MRFDLANRLSYNQGLPPASRSVATATGAGIDLRDQEAETLVSVSVGATVGTAPLLDVSVQESDDDGVNDAYAAIGSDNQQNAAVAQLTILDANSEAQEIFFTRKKRFLRVVGVVSGTNAQFIYGVTVITQKKIY